MHHLSLRKEEFFLFFSTIEMSERLIQQTDLDIPAIIQEFDNLPSIKAPQGKAQRKVLAEYIKRATLEEPITIFVGSCPDYSHSFGMYDHESLGNGVPFLTQIHGQNDMVLLTILERHNIPYQYIVMVADVEAMDEVFCERYAEGSRETFLEMCRQSQLASGGYLRGLGLNGQARSSSFFEEFGMESFMRMQSAYQEVLAERVFEDNSFEYRVTLDIIKRGKMYNKLYGHLLKDMNYKESAEFLVGRTIRTMAQYLALARLATSKVKFPMFINHPTTNVGLFNDRNKFTLPGDSPQPQPTIPVFELKQEVY